MNWNELMMAAKRHGVPCVVVGGTNGAAYDPDYSEYEGRHDDPPGDPSTGGGSQELDQLRAQVQQLTAEREGFESRIATLTAQVERANSAPQTPGSVNVTPTGDNGQHREQGADVLGLEDEKLLNKLVRLGYDTVGKVADAYNEGKLAEAKLKKDWLIAVGMALSGMFARAGSSAPMAPAVPAPPGGGGGGASDVPEGHEDRPWLMRLGLARDKHKLLADQNAELTETQAAYEKRCKAVEKAGNDPDEDEEVDQLGDKILELQEDIKVVTAHCVALKWSLGLNPIPTEKTLNEALLEANLGPWCEPPEPRVLP